MAIILAVDKWRSYLQHQEFVIKTDHRSLLFLTEQRAHTKLQHKALLKLMDLQFRIQYKQGTANVAADALSRCTPVHTISALSACTPAWISNLVQGYQDDQQAVKLLEKLALTKYDEHGYSLVDGVIKHQGRIWIGNNELAQQHVVQSLHSSGIGGHSSFYATYQRIKTLFAWPRMKDTIQKFIRECTVCQQAKTERVRLPGLLSPLPVPDQAWSMVTLDFVEGLPSSNRFNSILVVIDKFTKYGHFIPLAHPYTALQVAQLYMDNVYRLHGLPQVLISDRDKIFTSNVWRHLFKLTDTKLHMTSSYHPQSDGQTERLNQCLEAFLRCTV